MAALASLDGGSAWTESLKQIPKFIMEDVERFISSEKAPRSGLTKGYKFFCEGFIDNYEGICPVIGPECVTAVSKITESVFCNSFHWPPLQKLREDVYAQSRQRLVDWIGSYKIKRIGLV